MTTEYQVQVIMNKHKIWLDIRIHLLTSVAVQTDPKTTHHKENTYQAQANTMVVTIT